jgi:type I restriction enzyme R subunit
LSERGYGKEPLDELRSMIDAENSELYDVLAYIAFALAPISREERAELCKNAIFERYDDKQQEFLAFILEHYI